jgi:hypothetical protein
MAYTFERLPGERIIVVTWGMPSDPVGDAPLLAADIDAIIGKDEHIYCINDMQKLKMDFGGIVTGMAAQRIKVPGAPSDPRVHSLLVGTGSLWELASKASKQLQYGGINAPLFSTLEEALEYARSNPLP